MTYNKRVVDFIKQNKSLIQRREYSKIYENADKELSYLDGDYADLTEIFYTSGIDPLKYMEYVPQYYMYCSERKVLDIPDNIYKIGKSAFKSSLLEKVKIGKNVEQIDEYAFDGCYHLSDISIDMKKDEAEDINVDTHAFHGTRTEVAHCIDGDIALYEEFYI